MDQGWFVANLWFALALVAVGKDRFPIRRLRTLALAAQFFAKMVSNVASLLPTVRAFAYLGILVRRACGGLGVYETTAFTKGGAYDWTNTW